MNVEKRFEAAKKEAKKGMEKLGWTGEEDVPDWIEIPERFGLSGSRGKYFDITGDTYVYRCISYGTGGALVYDNSNQSRLLPKAVKQLADSR